MTMDESQDDFYFYGKNTGIHVLLGGFAYDK